MKPRLKGDKLELWRTLCAQAAIEQDPQKLMELVREIDRLLGGENGPVELGADGGLAYIYADFSFAQLQTSCSSTADHTFSPTTDTSPPVCPMSHAGSSICLTHLDLQEYAAADRINEQPERNSLILNQGNDT